MKPESVERIKEALLQVLLTMRNNRSDLHSYSDVSAHWIADWQAKGLAPLVDEITQRRDPVCGHLLAEREERRKGERRIPGFPAIGSFAVNRRVRKFDRRTHDASGYCRGCERERQAEARGLEDMLIAILYIVAVTPCECGQHAPEKIVGDILDVFCDTPMRRADVLMKATVLVHELAREASEAGIAVPGTVQ